MIQSKKPTSKKFKLQITSFKGRTKFPEARKRCKEIILLLQKEHLCRKDPYIDLAAGSYRIKLYEVFEINILVSTYSKDEKGRSIFYNLSIEEQQKRYEEFRKSFDIFKEIQNNITKIKNILDINGFEDCLVRSGGSSGRFIIVNVPYVSQKESL